MLDALTRQTVPGACNTKGSHESSRVVTNGHRHGAYVLRKLSLVDGITSFTNVSHLLSEELAVCDRLFRVAVQALWKRLAQSSLGLEHQIHFPGGRTMGR